MSENSIRLTQYSHGAGCGCKISPKVLETILHSEQAKFVDPNLLVGNETRDDAAVYDLGNGTSVISTTDFFMPIVDNPFDFGRIAATKVDAMHVVRRVLRWLAVTPSMRRSRFLVWR